MIIVYVSLVPLISQAFFISSVVAYAWQQLPGLVVLVTIMHCSLVRSNLARLIIKLGSKPWLHVVYKGVGKTLMITDPHTSTLL